MGFFVILKRSDEAVKAYMDIAKQHNISPAHLALAWCDQVNGVTSTIIGATTMPQLTEKYSSV